MTQTRSQALRNLRFAVAGPLTERPLSDMIELIQKHGGSFEEKISPTVTHVISTEETAKSFRDPYRLQFMPQLKEQIETANMYNKPFVTVEFIDKCIEAGSPVDHTPYLIPTLIIDVESRYKINKNIPSNLDPRVQALVKLLFDDKEIDRSLVDMGLDVRKIKLIDQNTISNAYNILKEIESKLQPAVGQTPEQHQNELMRLSEKFYQLIPHTQNSPPVIKSIESIKEKSELLGALTDIEIAQRLMKETSSDDLNMNPIDVNYRKLRARIVPLEHYRAEYQLIETMVNNTQSRSFKWRVNVEEIFEIEREGERERFEPFKKLPHHRLLWHGSRLANFIGILSQGLRIAPPEAPVSGYFLGKGIYFADMISVSASYCKATKERPYGLVLLCDVALGRVFQTSHGKFLSKEDLNTAGFHSVKCCGTKGPDSGYDLITPDGLIASLGRETTTGVPVSELEHNEIVVYDPAQVNIRYLVKLNFTFPTAEELAEYY